jgi:hypothetical protein
MVERLPLHDAVLANALVNREPSVPMQPTDAIELWLNPSVQGGQHIAPQYKVCKVIERLVQGHSHTFVGSRFQISHSICLRLM